MEIERKFLIDLKKLDLNKADNIISIEQGYLSKDIEKTIRVRIENNDIAYMTIKGATQDISREEIEFNIPLDKAKELFLLCKDDILRKTRYVFYFYGKKWEVDFFSGNLNGLILAEVELKNPLEEIIIPEFILEEVSYDSRYYNSNLICQTYDKINMVLSYI